MLTDVPWDARRKLPARATMMRKGQALKPPQTNP
jgi:hypothetical protein